MPGSETRLSPAPALGDRSGLIRLHAVNRPVDSAFSAVASSNSVTGEPPDDAACAVDVARLLLQNGMAGDRMAHGDNIPPPARYRFSL